MGAAGIIIWGCGGNGWPGIMAAAAGLAIIIAGAAITGAPSEAAAVKGFEAAARAAAFAAAIPRGAPMWTGGDMATWPGIIMGMLVTGATAWIGVEVGGTAAIAATLAPAATGGPAKAEAAATAAGDAAGGWPTAWWLADEFVVEAYFGMFALRSSCIVGS